MAELMALSTFPRYLVTFPQATAIIGVMWYGFDPDLWKRLQDVREMVQRRHQTPTREWPLGVEEFKEELLVVREWPNGSITAYTMPIPEASK
jgi:hypothetical protein